MEEILPGIKKFILDDSSVLPFLPIDGATGRIAIMKPQNLLIILAIALLVVIPQTLYVVDQTQIAIVTRFGEYQKTSSNPGLKFKTPFAEQVTKFDNRLLRVDAAPASILTADKRNLVIDSYARYRIVDPLQFYKSLRNEIGASSRVGDIVNAQLNKKLH